jgi:hypothetical protein
MANGFMSPVPSPLDFDPMRGYSSQMPVLGQGPMASQAEPAGPLMSVLGAAPVAPPAPRATPLASVLAQYGVTPDLASLELPRPGGGAMQSITMAAPGGPVAPPVAAAATSPAAAPPARAMARPGAAAGGVPDTFMGVDLTGAKQALAGFQREQPKSELGRIAYGVRSAEADAARAALTRAGAEQAGAVQTLEQAQEAQRVAAASEAELASQRADQARIEEENAAIERERRRQLVEETTQKLDAANKALDDSKIDIEAAYGGAAGRIFAGLAVALGSFGASMTGGPNYAMQLVNQRIDREIDAQKTELEKKKGKVTQLGQLLQRNEGLLGDAEQARRLAKAQTFKALADDVEARNKGRALTPQQAQVLQTLRSQQAKETADLELGVQRAVAARQMVGAEERQRQAVAAGAEAKRQRDLREKRAQQAFESGLKVEEALGIEAGKRAMDEGGPPQPGQAPPKAVEKVLDIVAKPALGTKDLIGALRSLGTLEGAIMAYGSPEAAPGGSTRGFVQTITPDITERARALTQTRTSNILDYRRAQTGTAAGVEEEKRITSAAGGDDPVANMRWLNQQRGKLLAELDTALKAIPAGQRDAVRATILQQAGETAGVASAAFEPVRKSAGK